MLNALARFAGARIIIMLVIGGAVAVGGFFFRDISSGSVVDLKSGDCFDLPSDADTVYDVQHHPCSEPHTAELVGLAVYPSATGATYPGRTTLRTYATNQCVALFTATTGRSAYDDQDLTVGWLLPTPEGWAQGDHTVSCHLMRADEGPMTQSYRIN